MTDVSGAALESRILGSAGGPAKPLTSEDAARGEPKSSASTLEGSGGSRAGKDDDKDVEAGDNEGAREPVKVNHRWTIYDPFNFSAPPPPPASMDDAHTIRLASANWLSQLLFWWIQPLLVLGYKRELEATDLPKMDETRQSGYLADKFEQNFARRRQAIEEWNHALDDGSFVPSRWDRVKWRMRAKVGLGYRADGRREIGLCLVCPALSDTFFWQFWSAGLFKIVADLAQTTSPLVSREIIRFVQSAYAAQQAGEPIPGVGRGVGMAIGLFFMQIFVTVCQNNTFSRSGQVGVLAHRKAFKLSGKARLEVTNAKLMSHISTSISRIECLIQLAEVIIILCVVLGASALPGIAIVLLAMPLQTWAMKKLFLMRRKAQIHTDERIKSISELLNGIRIVKFFAWEAPILDKVGKSRKHELGAIRKLLAIRTANQSIAMTLPLLSSVLVFAVYSLTGNAQDPAQIWTSLALLNLLLPNSLSTMTDAYSALKSLVPVFTSEELPEQLYILDESSDLALKVNHADFVWESSKPPSTDADKGSKGGKGGKGKAGKVDKAEKSLGEKKLEEDPPSRLEDIDLEVPKGQLLCIVGSVGSGKSSLLQGCIGEMRRIKGEVTFGGSIAYCAQSAWIMNTTLRANILFGRDFNERRYWECVRAACLLADLDLLPSGDMTQIGEKGITLSGGQRQRVSIARTLYSDADIILFDDPLSAVDAHVGAHIFEHAIQGLLKGKTRILVTHALQYLPHADNVIIMENGRIVERGTFDQLISAGSSFSRFAHEFGIAASSTGSKGDATTGETAEPAQDPAKPKSSSRPLMQKEEQATGTIKLRTWKTWLSAANGWLTVPLVIVTIALMVASLALSQFSLTWWQESNWGLGSSSYIGMYAGLSIGTAVFTFCMGVATVWFGTSAARNLHNLALLKVARAPMSFFDTTPLGRIMNRFAKDTDSIDGRLNDSLRMCLATLAQIISSIIMIAIVYPVFLAPVAAIVVLCYLTSNFYRASARAIKRHDNTLRSFLYAWFSESLTGLSTIRAYGEQERFLKGNQEYIDLENRRVRAWFLTPVNQRWLAIRVDTLGALLVFVVAIVAVTERTSLPPSQIGLVLTTTLAMQASVQMLVRQAAEVETQMNSIERFEWYAHELPQEAPAQIVVTTPPSAWPAEGAITFQDVEIRYRPELPSVVRDFSLSIRAGEKVGVVGRTGAGKSTITQSLFRIIELSKGSITIDGIDISTLGLTQLRERLSIIPQEPLLFAGTLRSNLDPFGLYDDARLYDALRRAWLVERTAGVDGSGQASRFTLDSPVSDEGANMSVGERSLVSLARALVKDAKIVCLDEATASVDLETDARIQATIRSEFKDKTLLTIAHRIQTIIGSDRILVLEKGEINAFATPLELFDQGGIFRLLCDQSNIAREDIVKAQEA
ncbi:hypothetical protein Rhopal_003210-T1 [Rhodotorula paludigena]|uniref:ABC transporter n=1 Tax=Rhodotorula paludigena TaxID=86838 RepID=A0AAV5GCC0_9BASI|nr:hypothetical protein Rhopal_003210-T1 [Rhodotorula paludigena]